MSKDRTNPFFLHYFVPVALILTSIVGFGATAFLLSLDAIEQVVDTSNRQIITDARILMDERLRQVGNIGLNLANNADLQDYLRSPASADRRALFVEHRISNALASIVSYQKYVSSAFIVIPEKRMVISDTAPYHLSSFFDLRLPHELPPIPPRPLGFHYMSIDRLSLVNDSLEDERTYLCLKLSMPLLDRSHPSVLIVLVIDRSTFHDLLAGESLFRDGALYLADDEGNVLAEFGSGIETGLDAEDIRMGVQSSPGRTVVSLTDNRRYATAIAPSGFTEIAYVSVMPERTYFDFWYYVRLLFFVFLLCSVLVGAVFSLVFARRQSIPLTKVYKAVRREADVGTHEDEGNLPYIVKRVADMNRRLRLTQPVVRENAIRRLLAGTTEGYGPSELDQLSIHFSHPHFCAVVVRASHAAGAYTRTESVMADVLDEIALGMEYEIVLGTTEIVILVNTTGHADSAAIPGVFAGYAERLSRQHGIVLQIGVGLAHRGLPGIPISFGEARRAADISRFRIGSGVTTFQEIKETGGSVRYPMNLQRRLGLALGAGDNVRAQMLLNEIVTHAFSFDGPANAESALVFYEIINATLKAVRRLREDLGLEFPGGFAPERLLTDSRDVREMSRNMSRVIETICRRVQEYREAGRLDERESFATFVEQEHSDPALDLEKAAGAFGYSSSYFSTHFRIIVGRTFKEYLTEHRIERAAAALRAGDRSVDEVLRSVGYTNYASFSRNFKRFYGVSPRTYLTTEEHDG